MSSQLLDLSEGEKETVTSLTLEEKDRGSNPWLHFVQSCSKEFHDEDSAPSPSGACGACGSVGILFPPEVIGD